ncbi:MAG: 16S rRNA (uracil(1498)-N(3))-methyltransferase [Gammaproteobacteria bacterium]|nr:16S rRNA (uracil(1498)-N(3))-methyltransferase [Gammaproteobacteria bacterium]
MRIPRIHHPGPLRTGTEVELPQVAARHVARVLRLGPDAPLVLFDGAGGEYAASLAEVGKRRVTARVGTFSAREVELPFGISLAQAVSRGDRMDLTLQKAVELGVRRITPLVTERAAPLPAGERRERRLAHWRGVVVSACEQCGRNRVPGVDPPAAFEAWLDEPASGQRLVLDPEAGMPLHRVASEVGPVTLLVGPEGGFTEAELDAAYRAGFVGVRLGPRVLRTETAALVALAQLQVLHPEREE